MFVKIHADNYRCLSNFTLEFNEFSALMGPNGAGKTTVLNLVSALREFLTGREKSLKIFPPESLTVWDDRTEQTFELSLRLPQGTFVCRVRLTHQPKTALNKVVEESLHLDGKPLFVGNEESIQLYNDSHSRGAVLQSDWHVSGISRIYPRNDNQKLTAFRRAIERILVLAPNPGLVTAVTEERTPVITPRVDCSDFAGWLHYISTSHALVRQQAEQNLAGGMLGGFRLFESRPSGDAHVVMCVFGGGKKPFRLRLDELSSGQIALVILETAISFAEVDDTDGPVTLFLDEPGNFLALPEVQPLLTRLRDGALEQRFQCITTAHHPVAVDFLAPRYGIWLDREPAGHTRVHAIHLSDEAPNNQTDLRVSDLVARGWLSGLGVTAGSNNDTRK